MVDFASESDAAERKHKRTRSEGSEGSDNREANFKKLQTLMGDLSQLDDKLKAKGARLKAADPEAAPSKGQPGPTQNPKP